MKPPSDTSAPDVGTCPTPERLVAVLSGVQPVNEELAGHLGSCFACQTVLDRLSDTSPLNELRKLDYGQVRDSCNGPGVPVVDNISVEARDTNNGIDGTLQAECGQSRKKESAEDPLHLSATDLLGKRLGQYQIQRLLGQGGMGVVFEATDTILNRNIALKLIRQDVATRADYRSRFLREAQAAAKVTHDNICPIYQVGESDGLAFIAMPLLAGETLEQRQSRQPLTLPQSLEVIRQTAEALAEAHQAGLVHRDIKPANIWLAPTPQQEFRVRILDFGLARFQSDDQGMTHSGTVVGTPSFMAPEQARGEAVDGRADLFSLGAVFYELLTGNRAFAGNTAMNVLSSILTHQPPPVSLVNSAIPESLSQIVAQLLEKIPSRRTPDAQSLLHQLVHFQLEQNKATDRVFQVDDVSSRFRSRWWWGLVALALTVCIVAGILIFQTPNGTLVVEFDDSADIRVKDGRFNIHDENGTLRYTLNPEQNVKKLAAGKYQVRVTGADGLQVNTDSFEMKRGEKVIVRVTAEKSPDKTAVQPADSPLTDPSPNRFPEVSFPGKALVSDDFGNADKTQFQLGDFSNPHSILHAEIENGNYECTTQAKQVNEKMTLLVPPTGLDAGAFVTRCRSQNGHIFFNVGSRVDSMRNTFISVAIKQGTWTVYSAGFVLEDGRFVQRQPVILASENVVDPDLMDGKWVDIAARWSKNDYAIWLNNKLVSSGPLPTETLQTGRAPNAEICVNGATAGTVTLELDFFKLFDQSGLTPENAHPTGLPR
jgi:serine/threonine protein kinase